MSRAQIMEKIMRQAIMRKSDTDKEYIALIKTYEYLKTNDYVERCNLATIFKKLYMMPDRHSFNPLRVSIDFGVSERSLLRYRKKFIAIFTYYYSKLSENEKENTPTA